MTQSMPEAPDFAVELERPGRQKRGKGADRDGVHGSDIAVEDQSERRRNQPQSAREVQPFGAQMIAAEAEVRRERERKTDDGRLAGGAMVRRVVGEPRRDGEPQPERKARPVLPPPHF